MPFHSLSSSSILLSQILLLFCSNFSILFANEYFFSQYFSFYIWHSFLNFRYLCFLDLDGFILLLEFVFLSLFFHFQMGFNHHFLNFLKCVQVSCRNFHLNSTTFCQRILEKETKFKAKTQNKDVQERFERINWLPNLTVLNKSFWNVRLYFVDNLIETLTMLNINEKLFYYYEKKTIIMKYIISMFVGYAFAHIVHHYYGVLVFLNFPNTALRKQNVC